MALLIESFLPATLTAKPMTDDQFAEFCSEYPELMFEMSSEGELIVTAPAFSLTGARNSNINHQLSVWAHLDGRGIVNDSSTGYVLPNGARRSPDASWVAKDKIKRLSKKSLQGFWHLCPAFVIELRSESDRVGALRAKMQEYIGNGAELGWLIDPKSRSVEIHRPNLEPQLISGIDSVAGEGPVARCRIFYFCIWNGYPPRLGGAVRPKSHDDIVRNQPFAEGEISGVAESTGLR